MKIKLEVIVIPKPHNVKEFKQSLNSLKESLQSYCSSLRIDESDDDLAVTIKAQWETMDQMHIALRSEEFRILSGAVNALCEKTIIWLDDKEIGNHISKLNSL